MSQRLGEVHFCATGVHAARAGHAESGRHRQRYGGRSEPGDATVIRAAGNRRSQTGVVCVQLFPGEIEDEEV